MAEIPSDKPLVEGVTDDLYGVRERGLERIDVDTKKQPRKQLPYLESLALAFCRALGLPVDDRIGAIGTLLHYGLVALAKRGYPAERALIEQLLFDPPGSRRRVSKWRMKAARIKANKPPDEFSEDWHAAFDLFGRFLVAYVRAAVRHSQARQAPRTPPMASMVVTPEPTPSVVVSPPPRRRRPVHWVDIALIGLVIASAVLVRLLVGTAASPRGSAPVASAPATTIAGYIECWPDTTKAVEGVWIVASNGGSGWADWHALPGQPNIALFSRTLPHGGSYLVHAGCGGSAVHWEVPLDSLTPVLGSGYRFTCYDTAADQTPYLGLCQP